MTADAASEAACAGLLAGVAALPATTGGDNAAMIGDLDQIAASIAPFTSGLIFVAHPMQASFLKLRRGWAVAHDITVVPSLGVSPRTGIGLDPLAVASASL